MLKTTSVHPGHKLVTSKFHADNYITTLDHQSEGRFVLQAPIVFWCHDCHQSVKRSTVGSRAGPKTWNALPEDYNIFPVWIHLSAPAQTWLSRSLFRTSSSDTDCILTFSLGLSVPTLPFKVYDDMILFMTYPHTHTAVCQTWVLGLGSHSHESW